MEISVVLPIYNEEKNIPILYDRLTKVLSKLTKSYELIFINDGSSDSSLEKLTNLRKRDKKIKIIAFSRNFGHMPAVNAGLQFTKGKRVVLMDSDLQDPPEIIPKLYLKSKEGFDVVYAVKENRKESAFKIYLFNSYYRILNFVSSYKMPLDAGTFSLMDRRVVDILLQMPEKNKYISGLRAWTGFSQTGVIYKRGRRTSGKPQSLKNLFKLAFDGMVSFSYLPLRAVSILGIICAVFALIGIIIVLSLRLFLGYGLIGWASTMTAILLLSGVQLISLGIIGEYLARIYDEVKNRPEYIIAEKYGL